MASASDLGGGSRRGGGPEWGPGLQVGLGRRGSHCAPQGPHSDSSVMRFPALPRRPELGAAGEWQGY